VVKIKSYSLIAVILLCLSLPAYSAQITFSPRLTLSEEYTDNVNRTREDREEDFIFRVTPGATLGVNGKKSGLSLRYDPSYSDYKINTDLNRWSHSAGLNAYAQFTKNTRGFFDNAFIYTEDPGLDESATGRTGRTPYFRNTSTVGVTNQFGAKDSWTLQYTHAEYRQDSDFSDDSTTYSPQFTLGYWFSSRWGFDTELRYTRGEFEITEDFQNTYGNFRLLYNYSRQTDWFIRYAHTVMDYVEDREDYEVYYPSLGFDYTYDENTFLSLEVGPLVRNYEDRSEEYGATAFADARKTWPFKRSNLSLFLRNGLDYDYVSSENLGLFYYTQAGGSANYQFTKDLSGDLNGSYRYNAYVDTQPERHDNYYSAGTGLGYRITYYCNLRLNYSYINRQSNREIEEYYENRVYLGVSFFPRSPYYLKR
jgi:hypothetical protein